MRGCRVVARGLFELRRLELEHVWFYFGLRERRRMRIRFAGGADGFCVTACPPGTSVSTTPYGHPNCVYDNVPQSCRFPTACGTSYSCGPCHTGVTGDGGGCAQGTPECFDLQNDPDHCGDCGTICDNCVGGNCVGLCEYWGQTDGG